MDLIYNQDDRRHKRLRFTLLKWLIFDDVHSALEIEEIPKGIASRIDVFVKSKGIQILR